MIDKTRFGWKRRDSSVSNSKLVLALMILISMILLIGGPINSDLTPSTQDLDQGFLNYMKEQFVEFSNGKSALTGAAIGLPVTGNNCYNETICVNTTVENCSVECNEVCVNKTKESCVEDCSSVCVNETVNKKIREVCTGKCPVYCVNETKAECDNECNPVCVNSTIEECGVEEICPTPVSTSTPTTTTNSPTTNTPKTTSITKTTSTPQTNSINLGQSLGLLGAPTITGVIINTSAGGNATAENITVFYTNNNTSAKNITNWKLNGTSIAVLNMPFEKVSDSVINATKDYSGNDNNGSEINGPTWNPSSGYDGKGAFEFDYENNEFISISDSTSLDSLNNSMALALWFKLNSTPPDQYGLAGKGAGANQEGFFLTALNSGDFRWHLGNGTAESNVNVGASISVNIWHHVVALLYPNGTQAVYLDGVKQPNTADWTLYGGIIFQNANTFDIGYFATTGNYFNGSIDEVTVYNKSLSTEQIQNIYNNRTDLLSFNETSVDDNWSACITPNDGTEDGATNCSANLIVLEQGLPRISNLVINTSGGNNYTSENVTLYWDSTDPEDNDTKNITNWRVNSSSLTLMNMPFEKVNDPVINATKDYSGNSLNASEIAGPNWNASGGYDGKGAYEFDGSDDCLRIPASAILDSEDITVTFWIKTTATGDSATWYDSTLLLDRDLAGGSNAGIAVVLGNGNGKVVWVTRDDLLTSTTDISDNVWHHVAVTKSPTFKEIYIDGEIEASEANTGVISNTQIMYLMSNACVQDYASGTLDELIFFNQSLSADQILALYNNQTNTIVSQETNGGENWTACITPNDGTEDGNEVCSEGLILNSLEVVNVNVTSSSETNYTSENLTVNYTLQNGSTNAIFNWYLNGTSLTRFYFPLEDNNGMGTGEKDYSSYGNDHTAVNAIWNRTGGYDGKGAYEFDGSGDYLDVGTINPNNIHQITMSAWINKPANSLEMGIYYEDYIFAKGSDATANSFGLAFSSSDGSMANNKLYLMTYGAPWQGVISPEHLFTANKWHHVAGSIDGTNVTIYVDGVKVNSSTISNTITSTSNAMWIGRQNRASYSWDYLGSIDEPTIYDVVLTPDQIKAIYENKTDTIVSQETSIGDNWSACVTPNDGTEDGGEVCSENLTVLETAANNAPNTILVTLNATDNPNNQTNANLTCWANITDADADTVYANYTIYHNDTINLTGQAGPYTQATLNNIVNISSINTTKEDNWTCEVQAYDGTDYETDWNNATQLVIQNSPPDQATPTINSTLGTNYTSENITVYNSSTFDADNDAVKNIFDWKLNGRSIAVLNMPFEDNNDINSGTKDYSQFSNDGSEAGGVTWNATGGYDGKGAYEFDGVSGKHLNFNTFDFGDTFTITTWVKPNNVSQLITIMANSAAGANTNGFRFFINYPNVNNGIIDFETGNGATNNYATSNAGTVNFNEWNHIAVVVDKNNGLANIYHNGIYVNSDNTIRNDFSTNSDFRIGSLEGGTTLPFNGTIDEFLILNRSLSADQILAIYNNRTDLIDSQETLGGENWSACITPNDGTQDGTEVCSEGLILNNIEVINVNITSDEETNYTSENLTANYTLQNGSDKGIIDWRLNGSSIAVLNMPFEKVNDPVINATKDYSQFSNDGSEKAGVTWNATGGFDNKGAYEFDGTDDHITTPSIDNAFIASEFTLASWFKVNSDTVIGSVIRGSAGGGSMDTALVVDWSSLDGAAADKLTLGAYSGSTWTNQYVIGTSNVNDGNWHFGVGTYDGTTFRVYVDGVLENSKNIGASPATTSAPWYVGRYPLSNAELFKGTIDEIMILNRTLTPEQILNMYNNRTDLLSFNETSVGDNWSACVTPNDGTEDGGEVCSENLTVLETPAVNTAPNTTIVTLNATDNPNNYTTANLSCYTNITDTEADTIYANYTIYHNDTINFTGQAGPFTQATLNNIVNISSENTTKDDNWTCEVVAYDGTDYETDFNNATIIIQNSPPDQAIPTINSTLGTNYTSENLTIYNTSTIDLDNDVVKNIFDWKLNGTSIAVLNMPFEKVSDSVINATKDYSGNDNNGSEAGGVLWNATGGYDGKGAYEFDGVNDYVDKSNFNLISYPITISAWAKSNNFSQSGTQAVASIANSGVINQYLGFGMTSGQWYLTARDASGAHDSIEGTASSGWHHYVGVFISATDRKLYVDGVETNSDTASTSYPSANVKFSAGRFGDSSPSNYFNGTIDEFLIFNRSLTEEQILALYENKTELIVSQETRQGENWSACVTPNDGTEDGTEQCVDLILNNLEVVNVTVTSDLGTNITTENLTVNYTLQNGSTRAIIDWRLNGSSIATLNLPFEDNNDSNTGKKDYSMIGNDGDVSGANWNATSGYGGKGAYEFDGGDDFIDVTSFAITSYPVTFSLWANITDSTQGSSFISIANGGVINEYIRIGLSSNQWLLTARTAAGSDDQFAGTSATGWHHFVGVFTSATDRKMYVDSNLEVTGTASRAFPTANVKVSIGRNGDSSPADYFKGTIDEVQIFNRSLTPEQILNLYNNRTDLLSFNETSVGDNWSACITPNDGTQDGTEICSENLTVLETANTPPNTILVILNATDNPNNRTTANLTCYANLTDADADTVYANYTIYHHDTLNFTGQAGPFTQAILFNIVNISSENTTKDDNWTCEVQAYDGTTYEADQTNSTQLVIQNSPPDQATPTINSSSGTNYTSENLTVYNTSTADADNDAIKNIFDWRLNGTSLAVLNMPFEDNNNTNSGTKDYSQFYNDGTVSGAIWNLTSGYDGKGAYEFDGIDTYVGCGIDVIDLSQPFTLIGWGKLKGTPQYHPIIGFDINNNPDNSGRVGMGVDDGGNFKIMSDGETPGSGSTITPDIWYHMATVYDGSQFTNYLNGENDFNTTPSGSNWQSSTYCFVGWHGYTGGSDASWNGTIDEVMIFNHSLSQEQISAIYNNKTDLIVSQETSVNDNWSACITPNDGTQDGSEVCSENLNIIAAANNAPNTISVTLNATDNPNNYTTANLTCWTNITDADADTVYANYTIYHNDTINITGQAGPFTQATLNNIVNISSQNTTKDDNWTCEVQGYDGTTYETDYNNATQLVIQNSPPGQAIPIINSTFGTNYTSENLTIYNTSTTDLDNDAVKNIFDWRLNGSSIAVLNMPFEDNNNTHSGTKDYSQFSNDGSEVGGVTWNATGGYDGKGAYEFDGKDDIIRINDDMELPVGEGKELSVSLWINTKSNPNGAAVLGHWDTVSDAKSWEVIFSSDSRLRFRINDYEAGGGGSEEDFYTQVINGNQWYHLIIVYNDNLDNIDLYVDGSLVNDNSTTLNIGNDAGTIYTTIGGRKNGAGYTGHFNGTIDEVLIFNRSLTPEQIQNLYNNRTDMIVSQETRQGDNWSACITPNDGTEDGNEVCSENLTVLAIPNNFPNTILVTFNATDNPNNQTTANLTCYANITDADADTVYANYTIYHNDTANITGQAGPYTQATLNNIVNISSENTTKDDNWTCEVQAYDGTDYETDFNNATIIIQNSPPQQGTIIINSSSGNNYTSENLTVYNVSTNDNDSDSIKNIFDWKLNGSSIVVLNMPFEDNNNTNSGTKDYSQSQDHGDEIEGVIWNGTGGYDGKGAYEFDGVDDGINISSSIKNMLVGSESMSVTAWVNPKNFANNNSRIVTKEIGGMDSVRYGLHQAGTNGEISFSMSLVEATAAAIPLDSWTHLVGVYDGENVKIYVNGILSNSSAQTGSMPPTTTPVGIGFNAQYNTDYFNGTIDEVRIYSISLTDNQILNLYNNRTDLISFNETSVDDNWSACITPNDGTEDGNEVCSENLTVLAIPNNAPNTISVILNATDNPNNYTTANLTCWANITDTDLDTVYANYTIYHNDTINTTGQAGPFTQATLFNIANVSSVNTTKDDNWTCEVQAYDGTDYEIDWNNATQLVIQNTPPTSTSVNLTSNDNQNRTNGTLTGVWTFADNDGDSQTNNQTQWYNNSVQVADLDNLESINSSNTTKDENWTFSVRVYDGTDWSSWINGSLMTINNTPPTFDEDLTNQNVNSGIAMNLDINCSDLDSDIITYYDNTTLFNINSSNGYINDTPDQSEAGAYTINITCGDGEVNISQAFTYAISDATAPTFSNANNSSDNFRRYQNFTANITIDNTALDMYIFSTNTTGTWTNSSPFDISGAQYNATTHTNISLAQGNQVCWYYWANDTAGNNGSSTEECFIVANTQPDTISVTLNATDNPTNYTTANLTCWANITDIDADTVYANYTIYHNDTINTTGQAGPFTQATLFNIANVSSVNTTKDDNWTCEVQGYDGTDYETDFNNATQLVIQNTPPTTLTLDQPTNSSTITNNTPSFNWTTSTDVDNDGITYEILIDDEVNFNSPYTQNNSTITTNSYTATPIADGTYYWKVKSITNDANSSYTDHYTFMVSTGAPVVSLISPVNNAGDTDGNITFSYNVSSDLTISNCSLVINEVINQTNTSITKNITQNFILNNLAIGQYNWSVNCTDNSNAESSSSTRIISIIEIAEFGGDTTNLNGMDISNITNLIIDQPTYGKINFTESVDLSGGANINYNVNISDNRIEINSTALPALNKSATLYLYNLSYTNPRILRDDSVCDASICTKISYSADGNLTFNVTEFSVYSAEETPTTPTAAVTAGGGGGGGAGGAKECTLNTDCQENQYCFNYGCYDYEYECTQDSDCSAEEYCIKNTCMKIFDLKVLEIDSPIQPGEFLDFTYFIKSMSNQSGDVTFDFWLEKEGKKVSTGSDIIYVGGFEEKSESAKIFLPSNLPSGDYDFKINLLFGKYEITAHRSVEIKTEVPLLLDLNLKNIINITSNQFWNYSLDLRVNKDYLVPVVLDINITQEGKVIWNKQSEKNINQSLIITDLVKGLTAGEYYIEISAKYDNRTTKLKQAFVIGSLPQKASLYGQAIAGFNILKDWSRLWIIFVIILGILIFVLLIYLKIKKRRTKLVTRKSRKVISKKLERPTTRISELARAKYKHTWSYYFKHFFSPISEFIQTVFFSIGKGIKFIFTSIGRGIKFTVLSIGKAIKATIFFIGRVIKKSIWGIGFAFKAVFIGLMMIFTFIGKAIKFTVISIGKAIKFTIRSISRGLVNTILWIGEILHLAKKHSKRIGRKYQYRTEKKLFILTENIQDTAKDTNKGFKNILFSIGRKIWFVISSIGRGIKFIFTSIGKAIKFTVISIGRGIKATIFFIGRVIKKSIWGIGFAFKAVFIGLGMIFAAIGKCIKFTVISIGKAIKFTIRSISRGLVNTILWIGEILHLAKKHSKRIGRKYQYRTEKKLFILTENIQDTAEDTHNGFKDILCSIGRAIKFIFTSIGRAIKAIIFFIGRVIKKTILGIGFAFKAVFIGLGIIFAAMANYVWRGLKHIYLLLTKPVIGLKELWKRRQIRKKQRLRTLEKIQKKEYRAYQREEHKKKIVELKEFINICLAKNYSPERIKKILLDQGWSGKVIISHLKKLTQEFKRERAKAERREKKELKDLQIHRKRSLGDSLSYIDNELKRVQQKESETKRKFSWRGIFRKKEVIQRKVEVKERKPHTFIRKESKQEQKWKNKLNQKLQDINQELEQTKQDTTYLFKKKFGLGKIFQRKPAEVKPKITPQKRFEFKANKQEQKWKSELDEKLQDLNTELEQTKQDTTYLFKKKFGLSRLFKRKPTEVIKRIPSRKKEEFEFKASKQEQQWKTKLNQKLQDINQELEQTKKDTTYLFKKKFGLGKIFQRKPAQIKPKITPQKKFEFKANKQEQQWKTKLNQKLQDINQELEQTKQDTTYLFKKKFGLGKIFQRKPTEVIKRIPSRKKEEFEFKANKQEQQWKTKLNQKLKDINQELEQTKKDTNYLIKRRYGILKPLKVNVTTRVVKEKSIVKESKMDLAIKKRLENQLNNLNQELSKIKTDKNYLVRKKYGHIRKLEIKENLPLPKKPIIEKEKKKTLAEKRLEKELKKVEEKLNELG